VNFRPAGLQSLRTWSGPEGSSHKLGSAVLADQRRREGDLGSRLLAGTTTLAVHYSLFLSFRKRKKNAGEKERKQVFFDL